MKSRWKTALAAGTAITVSVAVFLKPRGIPYDHAELIPWTGKASRPKIPITINGQKNTALLDSGTMGVFSLPSGMLAQLQISSRSYDGPQWSAIGGTLKERRTTGAFKYSVGTLHDSVNSAGAIDYPEITLGATWMLEKGAVIDCGGETLALPAAAGRRVISRKLRETILQSGFSEGPLLHDGVLGMVVRVRIAGSEHFFLVDTGSQASIIDQSAARTLGIRPDSSARETTLIAPEGPAGGIKIQKSPPVAFSLAGINLRQRLLIFDLSDFQQSLSQRYAALKIERGFLIEGFIGMDVLLAH